LTDYWLEGKARRPLLLCDNTHMLLYYPYTCEFRQADREHLNRSLE